MHISVEDVDEPPEFRVPFYYVEVSEDVEIGTIFTSVSAQDPDVANNSIRYKHRFHKVSYNLLRYKHSFHSLLYNSFRYKHSFHKVSCV